MNKPRKCLWPTVSDADALIGEAIRVRAAFKAAEPSARDGDMSARFVVQSCLHDEPKAFAAVKAHVQARGPGGRVLWERFLDTMEAV